MGLSKRRFEAEDADINREMRLCIGCENRADYGDECWRIEESFTGPITTVYLCEDCRIGGVWACTKCDSHPIKDGRICSDCLGKYRAKIYNTANEASCDRCGCSIPIGEWDEYIDTGLCGWCSHMDYKVRHEDEHEYGDKGQPDLIWTPNKDLILESQDLLLPEQFFCLNSTLSIDPKLLSYLHENPKLIHSLSPREFEELVADLLTKSGFAVKLGPKGRDHGVDVFAERKTDFGPELVIVQCKKYREDRKIGEPVIKQLHADVRDRDASKGLLVTSSSFSSVAKSYIDMYKYKLQGKDFASLKTWIDQVREGSGSSAPSSARSI